MLLFSSGCVSCVCTKCPKTPSCYRTIKQGFTSHGIFLLNRGQVFSCTCACSHVCVIRFDFCVALQLCGASSCTCKCIFYTCFTQFLYCAIKLFKKKLCLSFNEHGIFFAKNIPHSLKLRQVFIDNIVIIIHVSVHAVVCKALFPIFMW